MKTITVLETAIEIIDAARTTRAKGDESPNMPSDSDIKIYVKDKFQFLAEGFEVSDNVTVAHLIRELCIAANVNSMLITVVDDIYEQATE